MNIIISISWMRKLKHTAAKANVFKWTGEHHEPAFLLEWKTRLGGGPATPQLLVSDGGARGKRLLTEYSKRWVLGSSFQEILNSNKQPLRLPDNTSSLKSNRSNLLILRIRHVMAVMGSSSPTLFRTACSGSFPRAGELTQLLLHAAEVGPRFVFTSGLF